MDPTQTAMLIKGQRLLSDILDNLSAENDKIKAQLKGAKESGKILEKNNAELQKEIDHLKMEGNRSESNDVADGNLELEAKSSSLSPTQLDELVTTICNEKKELEGQLLQMKASESSLKQKIEELEGENARMREEFDVLEKQRECLEEQLRQKDGVIAEMEVQATETADQLAKLEAKRLAMAREVRSSQATVANQKGDIAALTKIQAECIRELKKLHQDNALLRDQIAKSEQNFTVMKEYVTTLGELKEQIEVERQDAIQKLEAESSKRISELEQEKEGLLTEIQNMKETSTHNKRGHIQCDELKTPNKRSKLESNDSSQEEGVEMFENGE